MLKNDAISERTSPFPEKMTEGYRVTFETLDLWESGGFKEDSLVRIIHFGIITYFAFNGICLIIQSETRSGVQAFFWVKWTHT